MNAASFPEYMPYGFAPGCTSSGRDAQESSSLPAGRRVSQAARTQSSLVQRALVWITDSVKSRLAVVRIRTALAPYIRSVCKKGAADPTQVQLDVLASALEDVFSIQHNSQGVVRDAVSRSVAKMDRTELVTLRSKLGEFKPVNGISGFSQRVWESLYLAISDTLDKSICRDAQFYVLNALEQIAGLASSGGASRFNNLEFACAFLMKHLEILTADNASSNAYASQQSLSPMRQMACIPDQTEVAVRQWFSMRSPTLQEKVFVTLNTLGNGKFLPGSRSDDKNRRLAEFCRHMKGVLASARQP